MHGWGGGAARTETAKQKSGIILPSLSYFVFTKIKTTSIYASHVFENFGRQSNYTLILAVRNLCCRETLIK